MNLAPATINHGERFGRLTVLERVSVNGKNRYRCGCECGFSNVLVRAAQLMKGKVKACLRCTY